MKTPLRLLRLYRRASALLAIWDEGRAAWAARTPTDSPTAYTSPGWWERLLTAARELALVAGLPRELEIMVLTGNWKTTAAGLSTILAVVAKVISTGQVDWQIDGPAILTAIGLIVAKDAGAGGK